MKNGPRSININVTYLDNKVILSAADFERLLKHITDREIKQVTSLHLRPKTKTKRQKKNGAKGEE